MVAWPLGYGPYVGKREEVSVPWKAEIIELAACLNVVMKFGGLIKQLD